MDALLGEALDAGAFGMSTGLIYAPSVYADTAELIGLVQTLGRRPGRLYTSHIRGEGPTLEAAIAEAIRIGDEAWGARPGLPPEGLASRPTGRKMGEVLRTIETARARGVDVTADMYPYTAGSTTLASLLSGMGARGGHGHAPRPARRRRDAPADPRRRSGGRGGVERPERRRRLDRRHGGRVSPGAGVSRGGRWPRSPPPGRPRPRRCSSTSSSRRTAKCR